MPKKKKGKRFGKRLGIYVLVMLLIFAAALGGLWFFLSRYQTKVDAANEAEALQRAHEAEVAAHELAVRRAPQLAFESWYASMTPESWASLWYEQNPEGSDGQERVAQFMQELFASPEVYACKGLESTEDAPVFLLKNSEQTLVRATVTGSDVNWQVQEAVLMMKGDQSASVRVATGSTVYCNGQELTADYASAAENTFPYEPLADKLENPVSWSTYTVSGMLLEPELTVTPPQGCHVTETANGDFLLCLESNPTTEGYRTKAVNFTKAYLYYYLSGLNNTYGNLNTALSFVSPGSQAYADLQGTLNGVIWNSAHASIDTSNVEAGDVVIWADNCYSVDVTYSASGMVMNQLDEYNATMRVYFTNNGAGFAITHFETL